MEGAPGWRGAPGSRNVHAVPPREAGPGGGRARLARGTRLMYMLTRPKKWKSSRSSLGSRVLASGNTLMRTLPPPRPTLMNRQGVRGNCTHKDCKATKNAA